MGVRGFHDFTFRKDQKTFGLRSLQASSSCCNEKEEKRRATLEGQKQDRPRARSIRVGTKSRSDLAREGKTDSRARTHTRAGATRSKARGAREDRETAGWMAGSVSNYRLLIIRRLILPRYPRSSFYAGTQSPRKVGGSSARNDSINNASSAIALNAYPLCCGLPLSLSLFARTCARVELGV